jgi:signal transduction histidine kinase
LSTTTRLPAPPLASVAAWPGEQPPDEITRGLFSWGRRLMRMHPLVTDTLLAAVLLALSSAWLAESSFPKYPAAIVQTALIVPLAVRRLYPSAVFLVISAVAFAQWMLNFPLLGDAALLIALYTVAAHESRIRALLAAGLLEAGAIMATVRWEPAGPWDRSLLFLSATVVAALFAGLTVASGSRYLAWMDERARRLEVERDQQAVIGAAAERTRIARELHDIVSHSLSVVITLADAAALVSRADPGQGADAMAEVSEVGRHALQDMRAMLGVLRTDEAPGGHAPQSPQPGVGQLGALVDRISATGLDVCLTVEGAPFPLGAAAELTAYRIVQEALTNTLRHAAARHAWVTIGYDEPEVQIKVADDGTSAAPHAPGHGIDGMRERAALHRGSLWAGPGPDGGWLVKAILRPGVVHA